MCKYQSEIRKLPRGGDKDKSNKRLKRVKDKSDIKGAWDKEQPLTALIIGSSDNCYCPIESVVKMQNQFRLLVSSLPISNDTIVW